MVAVSKEARRVWSHSSTASECGRQRDKADQIIADRACSSYAENHSAHAP